MNQLSPVARDDDHRLEERHFVEDFSLYFEQMGYPRMAGRILGWLADLRSAASRSAGADWRRCCGASKGSLSTYDPPPDPGRADRAGRGRPGSRRRWLLSASSPGASAAVDQSADAVDDRPAPDGRAGPAMLAQRTRSKAAAQGSSAAFAGGARPVRLLLERELPALLKRWQAERSG